MVVGAPGRAICARLTRARLGRPRYGTGQECKYPEDYSCTQSYLAQVHILGALPMRQSVADMLPASLDTSYWESIPISELVVRNVDHQVIEEVTPGVRVEHDLSYWMVIPLTELGYQLRGSTGVLSKSKTAVIACKSACFFHVRPLATRREGR